MLIFLYQQNVMNENIQALKNSSEPDEQWDSCLFYIVKKKLNSETRFEFEKNTVDTANPKYKIYVF